MSFYRILQKIAIVLLRIYFKFEVIGANKIDSSKFGAVLISNHISNFDPIALGLFLKKRKLYFMAKKELFSVPVLRFIIKKLGAFAVDRDKKDSGAIDMAVELIKQDKIVAMFPQGHRSKKIDSLVPKTGFIRIAIKAKAKIIVSSVRYSGFWPRSKVYIKYEEIINYEDLIEKTKEQDETYFKTIRMLTLTVWQKVIESYSK